MINERAFETKSAPADLIQHDHVYVVRGFHKTAAPSMYHPAVTEIISRYVLPEKFMLVREPSGRPRVLLNNGQCLFISLAHAQNILLVAISDQGDLGVDIEMIRERKFMKRIAQRYFKEMPRTIEDFYCSWTAREAFIKAIGSNISKSLARIHTAQDGYQVKIGEDGNNHHSVIHFSPQENFVAALCRANCAQRDFCLINIRS